METIVNRTHRKALRHAFALGVAALLGVSQTTFAQEGKKAHVVMDTEKTTSVSGELQAVLYPSGDPLKLKVNFENPTKEKITIAVRNDKGETLYTNEIGKIQMYNSTYDLSYLPDGNYTMEVYSKAAKHILAFQIHTATERLASVQ